MEFSKVGRVMKLRKTTKANVKATNRLTQPFTHTHTLSLSLSSQFPKHFENANPNAPRGGSNHRRRRFQQSGSLGRKHQQCLLALLRHQNPEIRWIHLRNRLLFACFFLPEPDGSSLSMRPSTNPGRHELSALYLPS